MKTLQSEMLHLSCLLNTGVLSLEGIALFLRHAGYRVRHVPSPTIQEKCRNGMSDLPEDHDRTRVES